MHIMEPLDLWENYIDPPFKERAMIKTLFTTDLMKHILSKAEGITKFGV